MINHNVTFSIYLETRNPKKDETFPVKLRVTYQRKRKYYSLNLSMNEERFNKVNSERPKGKDLDQKLQFNELVNEAYKIANQMPIFSFELFERELFGDRTLKNKNDVYVSYDTYISKLKENEQFGTAETYENSKSSIFLFSRRKELLFEEIDADFLTRYEKWQTKRGKSTTTISMYLRSLRKLFNTAIDEGIIDRKFYPFGRNKYILPASKNIKKALSLDEISQIYSYEAPKGSTEEFAKDTWLYSYFCNGINIADIARLKFKDIQAQKITFIREKTKNTSKHNSKPIVVMLLDEAIDIINKWGNEQMPANFIFPILNGIDKPEEERKRIKQFTKTVNKYMKRIASSLEIDKPVTTYAARHSFSTILIKAGASLEQVKEELGHSNILTTQSYVDSFDDDVKMGLKTSLVAFKNKKNN